HSGPNKCSRGVAIVFAQLRTQQGQPQLVCNARSRPLFQPIFDTDFLERLGALDSRGMKNGRAKANFVNRAEQRKSQEFHQVGHGVELRICVESCACLCPTYFLFKAEFPEKRSKVIVGKQRHMVVPIPSDIAELPWAGQPAQERSGLAQSDVSAM